jgi:hypothetical protein
MPLFEDSLSFLRGGAMPAPVGPRPTTPKPPRVPGSSFDDSLAFLRGDDKPAEDGLLEKGKKFVHDIAGAPAHETVSNWLGVDPAIAKSAADTLINSPAAKLNPINPFGLIGKAVLDKVLPEKVSSLYSPVGSSAVPMGVESTVLDVATAPLAGRALSRGASIFDRAASAGIGTEGLLQLNEAVRSGNWGNVPDALLRTAFGVVGAVAGGHPKAPEAVPEPSRLARAMEGQTGEPARLEDFLTTLRDEPLDLPESPLLDVWPGEVPRGFEPPLAPIPDRPVDVLAERDFLRPDLGALTDAEQARLGRQFREETFISPQADAFGRAIQGATGPGGDPRLVGTGVRLSPDARTVAEGLPLPDRAPRPLPDEVPPAPLPFVRPERPAEAPAGVLDDPNDPFVEVPPWTARYPDVLPDRTIGRTRVKSETPENFPPQPPGLLLPDGQRSLPTIHGPLIDDTAPFRRDPGLEARQAELMAQNPEAAQAFVESAEGAAAAAEKRMARKRGPSVEPEIRPAEDFNPPGSPDSSPRFAFRARDTGEKGIPAVSHAQASLSEADVRRVAPSRTESPQEVVRIDLSKLDPADYEIIPRGEGEAPWVRFKREMPEDVVERIGDVDQVDIAAASKAEPPVVEAVAKADTADLAQVAGLSMRQAEKGAADVIADGVREFSPEAVAIKRAVIAGQVDVPATMTRRAKARGQKLPSDELGQQVYPGEEALTPAERQALNQTVAARVRELEIANKSQPTGRKPILGGVARNDVEGYYGVPSHKAGTPLEGIEEGPKAIARAIEKDQGNALELRVRQAVLQNDEGLAEHFDRIAETADDTSFDPESFDVRESRRPVPGQRGLPGVSEDVPQAQSRRSAPEQRSMFGGEMLQQSAARTTEGREGEGALFRQEQAARDRAEAQAQRTLPVRESSRAFHGSPHDFDRFELSDKTIGTGEGAQAYGHGLYFAGNKEVAEHYRETLSRKGVPYIDTKAVQMAKDAYAEAKAGGLSGQDAIRETKNRLSELAQSEQNPYLRQPLYDAANNLESVIEEIGGRRGKTYEVNLKPDEGDYLHWDKPLSEQSEKVKAGLIKLSDSDPRLAWLKDYISRGVLEDGANPADATYRRIAQSLGTDSSNAGALPQWVRDQNVRLSNERAASSALREAGIPGIKYLDGSSRSAGEGNYNYVIFNDADVDVVAKYKNRGTPKITDANARWSAGEKSALPLVDKWNLANPHAELASVAPVVARASERLMPYLGRVVDAAARMAGESVNLKGLTLDSNIQAAVRGKDMRVGIMAAVEQATRKYESRLAAGQYEGLTPAQRNKMYDREVARHIVNPVSHEIAHAKADRMAKADKRFAGTLDEGGHGPGYVQALRDVYRRMSKGRDMLRRHIEEALDAQGGTLRDSLQQAWAEVQPVWGRLDAERGGGRGVSTGDGGSQSLRPRGGPGEAPGGPGGVRAGGVEPGTGVRQSPRGSGEAPGLASGSGVRGGGPEVRGPIKPIPDKPAPTKGDKVLEAWRAGLVSAPGTLFVANPLGNLAEQIVRVGETATSAVVDRFFKGSKSRLAGEAGAEFAGAAKVAPSAMKTFLTDVMDAFKLAPEKPNPDAIDRQVGAIGGKTGRAVRIPFRILQAGDDLFKTIGGSAELHKLAWRESGGDKAKFAQIRENPSEALLSKVAESKKARTFQDPNRMAQSLVNLRSQHKWLNVVMPFVQTPANIASLALKRSPVGFYEAGQAYSKYRKAISSGADAKTIETLRGEAVDAIARPLLGTVLLGTFAAYAKAGGMTGSGPTDPKEKALLKETGWQPYSFVIGEKGNQTFVPFNRFEPVSSLLGFAADIVETRNAKDAGELFDKGLGSIVTNLTSKTYLQGIADAAELVNDPKRFAGQYASNLAASAVPNVVKKVTQAIDPVQRETRPQDTGWAGIPERIGKTVAAAIPVVSKSLPERKAVTGESVERPGNAASRLLSPIQVTSEKSGRDLEALMVKLGVSQGAPQRQVSIPKTGVKVPLTQAEYSYLQDVDKRASDYLRRVVTDPRFKRLTPEQQKAYLERTWRSAGDEGRKRLMNRPEFKTRAQRAVREARA